MYIRETTLEEQRAIEAGLRSAASFTHRRCQILLASQRGRHAQQIADQLSCDDQTVRNALTCTGYFAHPDISNIRILLLWQLKSGSCDGSGGLLPADD